MAIPDKFQYGSGWLSVYAQTEVGQELERPDILPL